MRFYTNQHKFYCGIDLHARTMYLCILDQEGKIILHRDIKTNPDIFLKTIAPYREDIVVAVECIFTCYWIADLCSEEGIPFVLGHALYMKAIHGGKAKRNNLGSGIEISYFVSFFISDLLNHLTCSSIVKPQVVRNLF